MLKLCLNKIESDLDKLNKEVKEKREQTKLAIEKAYAIDYKTFGMTSEAILAAKQVVEDIFYCEGQILACVSKGIGHIQRILREQPWESLKNIYDNSKTDYNDYGTSWLIKILINKAKDLKHSLSDECKSLLTKLEEIHIVYKKINECYGLDEEVHPDKINSVDCYYVGNTINSNLIDKIAIIGQLINLISREIDTKGMPRGMKFSIINLFEASERLKINIEHVHKSKEVPCNIKYYLK